MASAKSLYPFAGVKAPGQMVITGAFVTDGANAPTLVFGPGYTVSAPTAAGVYTVTLTDGPLPLGTFLDAGIIDSTLNSTARARVGSTADLAVGGTFTIVTASAAGTDARLTGPVVSWIAVLYTTGVLK